MDSRYLLMLDGEPVGLRVELGIRGYRYDLSKESLSRVGKVHDISGKLELKRHGNDFLTDLEITTGKHVPNYSERYHLIRATVIDYDYKPLDYMIADEVIVHILKLTAGFANEADLEERDRDRAVHELNLSMIRDQGKTFSRFLQDLKNMADSGDEEGLKRVTKRANVKNLIRIIKEKSVFQGYLSLLSPDEANWTKADKELLNEIVIDVIGDLMRSQGMDFDPQKDASDPDLRPMFDTMNNMLILAVDSQFGIGLSKIVTLLNKSAKDNKQEFERLLNLIEFAGSLEEGRHITLKKGAKFLVRQQMKRHLVLKLK